MANNIYVLNVDGMSCSHCENRIKKIVGALGGVGDVSVDLMGKKVTVEFDSAKISLTDIKNTIEAQGYEVR